MLALIMIGGLLASAFAFPDAAIASGKFAPVPHARGVPQGKIFPKATGQVPNSSNEKKDAVNHVTAESSPTSQVYGGGGGGRFGLGNFGGGKGLANPTNTIFVNVPQDNYPAPEPIAAGPPRKHYRIVFIRSPVPPPPQPILPPRVEQKTLIYVLHPRQTQSQSVLEVPDVKHDPQVYFIQYDQEPPTAQELQDLVQNTIGGTGQTNLNYGASSVIDGPPSPVHVLSPGPQPVYAASSSIENVVSPYHPSDSSQIQHAKVAQTFRQKLTTPEIIKAHANPRDSLTISQGFQQFNQQQQQPQQRPKFIQTRAASPEVTRNGSPVRSTPRRPSFRPREAIFTQKQKHGQNPIKKTSQEAHEQPSIERKSSFKNTFGSRGRPFRFGSKLKPNFGKEAQQPSKEAIDVSSI